MDYAILYANKGSKDPFLGKRSMKILEKKPGEKGSSHINLM